MTSLTIRTPDDLHVHLRDEEMLPETVASTGRCFKRAIAMPNLMPPITTTKMAIDYAARIRAACPEGMQLEPMVPLFLTNNTTREEIFAAKEAGLVASKLYPSGATTNSDGAVDSLETMDHVFEAMSEAGMLLLIHGEATDESIDIFDREKVFIEDSLMRIVDTFPNLKVVMEHITTKDAVEYVEGARAGVAATITPHHLLMNRNDMLVGGIKPHNYCLPVLKRGTHQVALRETITKGSPKFFLGTDSAPHVKARKETSCGCAGCYSAWSAIELYAEVFEQMGCLDLLEDFASHYGADFYGIPRNEGTITLNREEWTVPNVVTMSNGEDIVPFYAGRKLHWKLT